MAAKNITKRSLIFLGLLLLVWGTLINSSASAEDFAIVVLPDTQNYSDDNPDTYFRAQTQWIVENKDTLNIVYVAHEGDIVNSATTETQWQNADAAMSLLEDPIETGLADGIPYGVVPGNHDSPTVYYNQYFGIDRFTGRTYYGGSYDSDNNDNYTLFSAGGMDFIVINLDYNSGPSSAVLSWADGLLQTYSDRRAIVVSHSMLNTNGTWTTAGTAIYNALEGNENLFLMLCGHMHGEAMRTETATNGNTVYVLLADYQDAPNGGNGWLRIMEFSPANDEITVKTYSPTLPAFGEDVSMGDDTTSDVFVLSYDMDDPADGFTAYNDCVYRSSDQYIGPNVTTYGIGNDFTGSSSGELLDQTTGNPTGVIATLTQSGNVVWQPDPTNGGADTAVGTDANNTFNGFADMTGVIYYGPSAGWYVDLTFTGLDPTKTYTFATSASRGNPAYTDRPTIYSIMDADTYTNASTTGVNVVSEEEVWFNTGDNYNEGFVARWTNITADDGSFTIRATHHSTANSGYKAYAFDVFMLQEEGDAPPSTEPDWIAFNDLNDATSVYATNVTTHDYTTQNGVLVDYNTGDPLTITMSGTTIGGYDPQTSNGGQANAGTDAGDVFGPEWSEIVDLVAPIELDAVTWDNIVTFDNLNPSKEYTITLTANRNELDYAGARFTKVTIEGADAYTNASSAGVVVNSDASVSFSVGYNTEHGYVAKWTGVTAADGSFSIKSEWDDAQGSGTENTKGYAMGAFKLEQFEPGGGPPPGDADGDGVLDATDTCPGTAGGEPVDVNGCSVAQGGDLDDDGMPDQDEIFYFGNTSRDGFGDYDGDGELDIDEILNGTDPTMPPYGFAFVAYNDLAAPNNTTPSDNYTVITTDGGANTGLPHSGELLNFADGSGTGVTLTVTGGDFNGDSHVTTYTGGPAPGTDAYSVFNGKVDALGSISYDNAASPGGDFVLTLTGMSPGKLYNLVLYGHRNDYGWDRASLATLSGADDFANESSPATDNPYADGPGLFSDPNDDSTRLPSDNDNGYVARFNRINPGSDGEVVVTLSPGAAVGENRGKYANAVMLQEIRTEPPPQALPILEGDNWRYFKGTEEPPLDWADIGFEDSTWLEGPTGIGYGDGDDATELTDMLNNYLSVYARKEFAVSDPSAITGLDLSMDYDDGFVAYLNGVEVARNNVSGTPPAYDTSADGNHEASGGGTGASPVEHFAIDPSLLVAGINVLSIQGHNLGNTSSDFSLIPTLEEVTPPPENWVAYNDLNGVVGDNNASNVTRHDYTATDATLKDYNTGADLAVTITGITNNYDPKTGNGGQANAGTDAADAFGPPGTEIVDLVRGIELDSPDWDNIIEFNNLDSTKEYVITLTANRNDPTYTGRWTRVTIEGADSFINESSAGVSVSDPGNFSSQAAVSFNTGYNTVNGYVAKWTGVTTGPDGSFTIKSEREDGFGASGVDKGYAMTAFKLEQVATGADADGDGVPDGTDICPGTAGGEPVDANGCSVAQGGDLDDDGMPDQDEIFYFGDTSRDGSGDYDGDGVSDLDEILNGTDPTLPPLPILKGDNWRYFKGTVEPPSDWKDIGFDDSTWLVGPTGIGYGDGDDATELTDMKDNYLSVYARKVFTVSNPSAITGLDLSMDYDDGFVAYLNGVEVARNNVSGTPPAYDTSADGNHESSGGGTGASPVEHFAIDPSLLVAGTNVLSVQGHNLGNTSSDFSLIPTLEAVVPPLPPLPIQAGDDWRYFPGTEEPPSGWNAVVFDDSGWMVGPSGFGYGDGDDATLLDMYGDNLSSVYVRKKFTVIDSSAVAGLRLSMDFDDGFVAYLNGTEIARFNLAGAPPAFNEAADPDHGAVVDGGAVEYFNIDPSLLLDGTNVLAVQGHNGALPSSDLTLIPTLEEVVTPPSENWTAYIDQGGRW